MQQNTGGGRYIKAIGVQGIVVNIQCIAVKNPDASWVEIDNFFPVQIRSAALLARFRLARAAATSVMYLDHENDGKITKCIWK